MNQLSWMLYVGLITSLLTATLSAEVGETQKRTVFRGKVVDSKGEPIGDALVIAQGHTSKSSKVPDFASTHTNSQGDFEVECIVGDKPYRMCYLWAYADGYSIRCVQALERFEDNELFLTPQEG